jgi:hypothetical protein
LVAAVTASNRLGIPTYWTGGLNLQAGTAVKLRTPFFLPILIYGGAL